MLEKTLESPLDCKEIQPVHPKGNQSWLFIGRTDAEAETPIPWPPDANNWLTGKDPDTGKDWGREEKGTTEDEMVIVYESSMSMMLWVTLQQTVTAAMKLKRHLILERKAMTKIHSILKSRNKCPFSQRYGFSSSLVWVWEVDHKESWALKN